LAEEQRVKNAIGGAQDEEGSGGNMSEEPTCTGCNASGKQPCSVGQGRGSWYDPPQTANGIAQLVTWAYGGRHGSDMPHDIGDREVGTAHTTDCTSELSKGWHWPALRTAVAGFLGSSSAATCGSIRLIGRLGRVLCPLDLLPAIRRPLPLGKRPDRGAIT
jgi:hypothetical protein